MTDSESPSPGHDSDTFDRNGSPLSDVSSPADTNPGPQASSLDDSSLTDTEATLKAQLAGFVESLGEGSDDTANSHSNPITSTVSAHTSTTSSTANTTTSTTTTTVTSSTSSTQVAPKNLTPAQSLARKLSEKPPTKLYKKTQTNRRRSPPVASNGPIAIAPAPVLRPLLPKPVVPLRPKKRAKSVGNGGAATVVPTTVAPSAVTNTSSQRRTKAAQAAAAAAASNTSSSAPVSTTISPLSLSLPSKRKSSDVSTDSSLDMMLTPATTLDMSLDMSLNLDISQPNLDFWPDDLEWQDSGISQPKELNLEDIFYDLDEQIIA